MRVKELVDVQGMRDNALYGYGLVVGLAGTGDTEYVFFTSQSISGMLGRLGIRIDPHDVRVRNVAAVMVTARLPAFTRPGSHMDVNVSSMGNARSLAGGVLLITPLTGADGQVYGLAQGPVQAGGIDVTAFGSSFQKNQPTSGRVPAGATIERAVAPNLDKETLTLGLKRPDFTTATNLVEAINKALGEEAAKAVDPAQVELKVPAAFKGKVVGLLTKLETLEIAVRRPGPRGGQRAHRHRGGRRAGAHPPGGGRPRRPVHLHPGRAGGDATQRVLAGQDHPDQAGPDRRQGEGEAGGGAAGHHLGRGSDEGPQPAGRHAA